ncbi:MAG TPA: penicillin acylase family protein, partial [Thermoanaerobaculia bacterium]
MRRSLGLAALILLVATAALAQQTVKLPGMQFSGKITRDANGVTHIEAMTQYDMYFLQGYAHAQDRLFQMDYLRRIASGTLGELLGPAALPSDVQLRVMGLRSAAISSYDILSLRGKSAVTAYTAGVNAYLASNPTLPPEYAALEITKVSPWTPVDSVVVAKLLAFQLAFDLGDIDRTIALLSYQAAGQIAGFDGTKLFSEDLFRSQPFTPASTVPDASSASGKGALESDALESEPPVDLTKVAEQYDPALLELAQDYLDRIQDVPILRNAIRRERAEGSNMWAIQGRHTASGMSLMANDPHLLLDAPSVWYLNSIRAGRRSAAGHSFAGIPGVVLGTNGSIAWGSTVNPMDQTDVFQEKLEIDPLSPTGFATRYNGVKEFVFGTLQTWKANAIGDKAMDNLVT